MVASKPARQITCDTSDVDILVSPAWVNIEADN
jgi:hypothetical protein